MLKTKPVIKVKKTLQTFLVFTSLIFFVLAAGCTMPQLVKAEIPTLIPTPTWTVAALVFDQPTKTPEPPPPGASPQPTDTSPAPATVKSAQCPASPPQRVDLGMRARVTITDGTPLRVRQDPVVGNNVLFQIDEGTPFTIIGGPSCWADGSYNFTFWQILLDNNKTGWVAEGNASGYFIEPLP